MISEKISKHEKITFIGTLISFVISAAYIKISGLSVSALVDLPNTFFDLMMNKGSDTLSAVYLTTAYFFNIIIAFIFITLAFAFMASYGYYHDNKRFGYVLSIIGGAIFFIFLGFTVASAIVAIGLVASSIMLIPLANTYGQEFKKWKYFRVGSNTVSRAFFILNLIIALAVFVAVFINLGFYGTEFTTSMKESIANTIKPSLPQGVSTAAVDALIDQQVNSSPMFSAYIRWLPIVSAFCIWAVLEILRLFLPIFGGTFASGIIRLLD